MLTNSEPEDNLRTIDPGGLQNLQEALRLGLSVVSDLWSYALRDWVSCVHAADIDGDGDVEVLIATRSHSVCALTKHGDLKWKCDLPCEWIGAVAGIGDTEATDPVIRVVVGTRNSQIYGLDKTGKIIWSYAADLVIRQIIVSDIDQDGKSEVIAASEDRHVYALKCETGAFLWKYQTNAYVRSIYVDDVSNDNNLEIFVGSGDKYLHVLDAQGKPRWQYNAERKIYALHVADLNNDGTKEILVSTDAKDLYVLTADLQKRWSRQFDNRILTLAVADLNKDGRVEIIAGSEDKHLYFLDDEGNLLWKYKLGWRIFSLYVIDLDSDNLLELLVGSEDNSVHALRVELSGGERTKILGLYKQLGNPPSSELNLSPTERSLLRVLIDEPFLDYRKAEEQLLMASTDIGGQYFVELARLLYAEQQRLDLLWCQDVGFVRNVALGNILDDDKAEIVVGTGEGMVSALDVSGRTLWSYPLTERIRTLQLADFDFDGQIEIFAGSIDGQVYAISCDGMGVKWMSKLDNWITSIAIVPSAYSNQHEMVMGSEENSIYVMGERSLVPIMKIQTPQGILVVTAEDINDDDVVEIIAGAVDDNVHVYTSDGKKLWSYKTYDRVRAVKVQDIDGDHHKEIIVASEDRSVHVLTPDGNLKWRYCAPHRVLDVTVADINRDGKLEILLGCGDWSIYVLSSEGDLLWQYSLNDRVRVVAAMDVNNDGLIEIVAGTEDRLYLLQLFDPQDIQWKIDTCVDRILHYYSPHEMFARLADSPHAHLRAFAFRFAAQHPEVLNEQFHIIQRLHREGSAHLRAAFARATPALYKAYPDQMRRFLDILAGDRDHNVRLTFVDCLAEIVAVNREIGFAYLDRFMRNVNLWVRRAVTRELYELVIDYPQPAFRLLAFTAKDELDWIRQESARALARYFDHTDSLVEDARSLLEKGIDLSVYRQIETSAKQPVVRNVFRVIINLFTDLDQFNVQSRLQNAVSALESTTDIKYGHQFWLVYSELYRLVCMRNLDEIALYRCRVDDTHTAGFEGSLQFLQRLTEITSALNAYLKREGLGDRLASLLTAKNAVDVLYKDIRDASIQIERPLLSDYVIFDLLLNRWLEIILSELSRLSGRAKLRCELQTKSMEHEDIVSIWLKIYNDGERPADDVLVRCLPSSDYTVFGAQDCKLETVFSHASAQIEFALSPLCDEPRLVFEVVYSDADSKDEVLPFADRFVLKHSTRDFQPIPNRYSIGMPIRNTEMFYGRADDMNKIRADLVNTAVNVTVVLYGQRRSGKTSLLNQLVHTNALIPHIPIFIDMQNEALGITTGRFLRNIASYIHKELSKRGKAPTVPRLQEFQDDPTFVFNGFLDEVEQCLENTKLIFLIDEFEILEKKVDEHALPEEIFEYFRSLMQHRRMISFLFAGTHTIKQLTASYWSVFFNIAHHNKLSKLSSEAAAQLIIDPVRDYLEYDAYAIEKIQQLTADQPYLIQLICRVLVDHCNIQRKSYVSLNDVNTVLDDVMETGEVHFKWIWDQTTLQERIVLAILAQEGGEECRLLSLAEIEEVYASYGLEYQYRDVLQALLSLSEKDIIECSVNNTQFRVILGLSQRWLQRTKTVRRVLLEENLLTN